MAAPKGNKYALGNEGGRPRTVSPSDDEVIELGKDLVAWATTESDNPPLLFAEWYTSKGMIRSQFKLLKGLNEFRPYYEQARVALSRRFVNGTVNASIAHRYLRLYDRDVKEEENEHLRFQSEIRKEELTHASKLRSEHGDEIDEQIREKQNDILNQLSSLQAVSKESRSSSNKEEIKQSNDI